MTGKSLLTEHDSEMILRAFWRRAKRYAEKYGDELPAEIPVELICAMNTALTFAYVKTEALIDVSLIALQQLENEDEHLECLRALAADGLRKELLKLEIEPLPPIDEAK